MSVQVDAVEAARLGLANHAVDETEWRSTIDGVSARLARGFNRNMADGKATIYHQAAATELRTGYWAATQRMVEMFHSPAWQSHMRAFLERRKK